MVKFIWVIIILFALFFTTASPSPSASALVHHQPVFSIKSNQTERSCLYTVIIKTSCSSVSYTTDEISLAFGDAYGNEVYAPRIDDESRTFERCSRYVFEVRGPRMDVICYVSLMRQGSDGWKPDTIMIYYTDYRAIMISIDTFLRNGKWFEVNACFPNSHSAFFNFAYL